MEIGRVWAGSAKRAGNISDRDDCVRNIRGRKSAAGLSSVRFAFLSATATTSACARCAGAVGPLVFPRPRPPLRLCLFSSCAILDLLDMDAPSRPPFPSTASSQPAAGSASPSGQQQQSGWTADALPPPAQEPKRAPLRDVYPVVLGVRFPRARPQRRLVRMH